MNIYIDESGSINNSFPPNKNFVIALVCTNDKKSLKKAYKRFVSSNHQQLQILDKPKMNGDYISRVGGKMFNSAGEFQELKGSMFNKPMKDKYISFFARKKSFDLFFIQLNNYRLENRYCDNTARAFNYVIKNAISFFIEKGLLPKEDCHLQLDERNEKTETKYFLEN